MTEDYLIRIDGTQSQDDDEHSISLYTKGSFTRKNGIYYITYKETEATGFAGCTTTVKADGESKVSMLRFGPTPSQLIIEKGSRNVCHYETGHGSVSLGISADEIVNSLTDNGGELKFSYLLDMNSSCISKNTVTITVKQAVTS